eukprot:448196_1
MIQLRLHGIKYICTKQRLINRQRFLFHEVQGKNPLRCIDNLKQEHQRIKSTMQSFANMIEKMDHVETVTTHVSMDHWFDLKNFVKFCREYNAHHHEKEEVLYNKAEKNTNENQKFIQIKHFHDHAHDLYLLMDKHSDNELDSDPLIDMHEITLQSKKLMNMLEKHMYEEDHKIYDAVIHVLDEQIMEDLSQTLEEIDEKKKDKIQEMETISDQLQRKYK